MLVVVVPAQDERDRIGGVLQRCRATLPDAVLLVVDSGSRDDTAEVALGEGAQVLSQQTSGYPGALLEGVQAARAMGAHRLVVLDGDGQHPPEAAPELLAGLAHANWVTASRAGTRSPSSMRRRVANRALASLVALAGGGRWGDVTSGFHAWDRHALAVLGERLDPEVADANLRLSASRAGLVTLELPVAVSARPAGRSMHDGVAGLVNLQKSLRGVWRAARS